MLKLRLSYFGNIKKRQGSLEKTIMLGKVEGSRKRGRPNIRWTDSKNETTDRAVEGRTFWRKPIQRVTMSQR